MMVEIGWFSIAMLGWRMNLPIHIVRSTENHASLRGVVYCMCMLWRHCPLLERFSRRNTHKENHGSMFSIFSCPTASFFFSSVLYRGILFAVSWTPSSCSLHSKKAKSRACIWDTNHHRPACATDVFDEPWLLIMKGGSSDPNFHGQCCLRAYSPMIRGIFISGWCKFRPKQTVNTRLKDVEYISNLWTFLL